MDLCYIILTHKEPKQLKRLITELNEEKSFFYVHIDKKSEIGPFETELEGLKNVFILKERINVIWGNIGQVHATLLALKEIMRQERNGYCILMSGQDYPLQSKDRIRLFFEANAGKNYIDSQPIEEAWQDYKYRISAYNFHLYPRKRHKITVYPILSKSFHEILKAGKILKVMFRTKKISPIKYLFVKRKHPDYAKPYGGSQWWALTTETIGLIFKFIDENPTFLKYHEHTHVPDELFFHTIVSSLLKPSEMSKSLTYVNWTRKNCTLPVTFRSENDFKELIETNCLFARKFDKDVDILDKLDARIIDHN